MTGTKSINESGETMARRALRYSGVSNASLLRSNPAHSFAQNYALSIFRSRAIYSFIPKNACTTLRLSIAIENGAINREDQFRWVHNNNDTFKASLSELASAEYTFVILRCPFARLASCFLDKFVSRRPEAWAFYELTDGEILPANLTFRQFCTQVCKDRLISANAHWRRQSDFLVYERYDDYFCVETFAKASATISRKVGMQIVDARSLTMHGTSRFTLLGRERSASDMPVWEIEGLMRTGTCPNPAALYDTELRVLVAAAYAEDLALHEELFPGLGLFSNQDVAGGDNS